MRKKDALRNRCMRGKGCAHIHARAQREGAVCLYVREGMCVRVGVPVPVHIYNPNSVGSNSSTLPLSTSLTFCCLFSIPSLLVGLMVEAHAKLMEAAF